MGLAPGAVHRDGVHHLDRAVGLFGHLLPEFKKASGIDVKVVALGTGQALDTARRGDADVVFVHDQAAEEKFVAEGFGVKRYPVMYNDFMLVGPKGDPAGDQGQVTSSPL
jgi:tungstate transport system substrate-binding protein